MAYRLLPAVDIDEIPPFHTSISTVQPPHRLQTPTPPLAAGRRRAISDDHLRHAHAAKLQALLPRKKHKLRSRRFAADFAAGESEAAGASARPPLPASPAVSAQSPIGRTLPRDFFEVDALDLAPRLLGKLLRRDQVVLRITEVEAYRPNDSACHGRFGITARTAPVFGPGGHAYVYLCYGLHMMLNVVADKEGVGAAVLIRSCAPVGGLETIQQRRGQQTEKPVLLTGPGKVGQALGLSTDWSNHPLYAPGGLEVLDGPQPESILVGPRVGIEYALPEHVAAPWRFAVAGTPWISAPRILSGHGEGLKK